MSSQSVLMLCLTKWKKLITCLLKYDLNMDNDSWVKIMCEQKFVKQNIFQDEAIVKQLFNISNQKDCIALCVILKEINLSKQSVNKDFVPKYTDLIKSVLN